MLLEGECGIVISWITKNEDHRSFMGCGSKLLISLQSCTILSLRPLALTKGVGVVENIELRVDVENCSVKGRCGRKTWS